MEVKLVTRPKLERLLEEGDLSKTAIISLSSDFLDYKSIRNRLYEGDGRKQARCYYLLEDDTRSYLLCSQRFYVYLVQAFKEFDKNPNIEEIIITSPVESFMLSLANMIRAFAQSEFNGKFTMQEIFHKLKQEAFKQNKEEK